MSAYTDFILRTYYFYFILKTYYFYFILNLRSSDLHSYFVSRIVIQSSSYKTCYKARYRSQSCWKSSNEHTNRNHTGTLIFLHLERWYRPRFATPTEQLQFNWSTLLFRNSFFIYRSTKISKEKYQWKRYSTIWSYFYVSISLRLKLLTGESKRNIVISSSHLVLQRNNFVRR